MPGHGDRPVHAHGGRLVSLRPHDRRHRGGGAGIGEVARLRGRKCHFPRGIRGAQHASRTLAEWTRANDVRLSCSRTGNCRDNAVAESFFATLKELRDVLQEELRHKGRRQARGHRVHRGRLQPQTAPLHHRLPSAGAGHGVVLRTDQAHRRKASHGRLIPQASVSEILTQVRTGRTTPSSTPATSRT